MLEHRFRKDVKADLRNMKEFSKRLQGISIIRSIELAGIAFKMGLLDCYLPKDANARKTLLSAVLWATKYNGCAVTDHEVEELKMFILK